MRQAGQTPVVAHKMGHWQRSGWCGSRFETCYGNGITAIKRNIDISRGEPRNEEVSGAGEVRKVQS